MRFIKSYLIFILFFILNVKICAQIDKTGNLCNDSILKTTLESIQIKDQTLRLILPEIESKFGKDSKQLEYLWTLIHFQDSINEVEVTKIIDKYGWIGINRIGVLANQTLWLVIQHAPIVIQEKYLPLLRTSVMQGESEGWCLAYLEDRIAMRNGKKQVYGTQSIYDIKTKRYHIYPIQNSENIDERRKNIGLEPIREYAKKNGYIFNEKGEKQ